MNNKTEITWKEQHKRNVLRCLFCNVADCYADVTNNEVIQAMTEDVFVDTVMSIFATRTEEALDKDENG